MNAEYFINKLGLTSHQEGGYLKEVYQSDYVIKEFGRSMYTSAYFLLVDNNYSAFHSLKSDEIWYYHAGESIEINIIYKDGTLKVKKLGLDIDKGEEPQVIVPGNTIFSANIPGGKGYSLVSNMVSYGFDFKDFKLYTDDELIKLYPKHKELIERFTRS